MLTCGKKKKKKRKVEAKYQRPVGTWRPLEIHTKKWGLISVDFIMEFFISGIKKNIAWVIVDRLKAYSVLL